MTTNSVRGLWMMAAAMAIGAVSVPARATMFGTLSNFDVINDTGQITHGFEIELDGIKPADIYYTFGSPYERYGNPVKIDVGTGTIVRYASTFGGGVWAAGTPTQDPLHPIVTGGHQLWFQGDPNYLNLPGDHFGMAFNGTPTNTIYRWLTGDAAGNLAPAGTNVKIPAPVLVVTPPANPVVAPAAVQMKVAAPVKAPASLFGEAMWVKVFITESTAPAELEHLLVGDAAMPDRNNKAETEVEWQLLQAGKGAGFEDEDSGALDLGAGAESVTRRYEFYKYTGSFDSDGEALDEDPVAKPSAVGSFIGGQNAAVNLAAFGIAPVPEPGTLALLALGVAGLLMKSRSRRD